MISSLQIANRLFDFSKNQVYTIGILNVTPDSFSDGGKFLDPERALDCAIQMQEEGADLLDLGAESTRPGSQGISTEEEIERLLPVLKKLSSKISIPISIDTRKASVARMAIDQGVSLLNDVSGFQFDPEMIPLLQKTNIPAILMHSRGTPENMSKLNQYESIVDDLISFFEQSFSDLENKGVSRERILIDPGIGFAKLGKQNVEILSKLDRFQSLKRPILVGLSRKSFLEEYFGPTSHPFERTVGSEVAHALAILKGANFLRVHEVKVAKRTISFLEDSLL